MNGSSANALGTDSVQQQQWMWRSTTQLAKCNVESRKLCDTESVGDQK